MKSVAFPEFDLSYTFKALNPILSVAFLGSVIDPQCANLVKKRTGIHRKRKAVALKSICSNLLPIYSLTEGNKFRIQTCTGAAGPVPAEIPFSNHYYIMAALKRCFQIPIQSFSGLS